MSVQDVSVISSSQFEAMLEAQQAPETAVEVAQPPAPAPEPEEPTAPDPEPVPTPDVPEAETPPQIVPPSEDVAVIAPDSEPEPVPQQADRVAPEPVAQPEPDAAPDPEERSAVTEDSTGVEQQPEQDATAPEETTTQIVTEADEPATAPQRSQRPPSRRPTPPVETVEAPEPDPEPTPEPAAEDNVADAIASAVADAVSAPSGPPLTGGELEGLRASVSDCWSVGALSTEAQETKVTVFIAMNRDGTPKLDTMRMIGFEGGSEGSATRVYRTARSAIARCGRAGFPLPVEKYDQWQEIEMTFNPEGMFWR